VDILQPEVAALGGIMESFKIYCMAQSENVLVAPAVFDTALSLPPAHT
jgi:L-alanine-DL-glutamate epimerase-like enolase superfamily enzyme